MATTQAPLFGLDASGSIGGAITFAKWRGRTYARVKSTPSNPRSAGQVATRALFKFLAQAWGVNPALADHATWEDLAAIGNYSTFNAYQKYNMDRWTQFTFPQIDPAEAAGTVPVMGALTATAGVRQISLSNIITTPNAIWGMAIAMSVNTGFTPAKTDIVGATLYAASPVTFVITPVPAGTYYIRTAGFTTGGSLTAWVAEEEVIVA